MRQVKDIGIFKKHLFVLFSLLLPVVCFALPVEDLYVSEVFVTAQTDEQLRSGAKAGLTQVLVRNSGTKDVTDSPLVRDALRKPEEFYYQYSYQATDREFPVGDKLVKGRILRLQFEPSAIAGLLRDAGFPVWGSNRPGIMLWLAVSDANGRRLIGENDQSELVTAMSDLARERGLPLLYPLLDIEDAANLSTAEVWGAFLERIDTASGRYNPDSVLTGRVQQLNSGQWRANWNYRIDDRWQGFENVAFTPTELITDVVDRLADDLAHRFAVGSSQGQVELQIEAIDSAKDYADTLAYLQSLTPVLVTDVVDVKDDTVTFKLSTEGRLEQLVEIIDLDKKMLLLNSSGRKLQYRWLF